MKETRREKAKPDWDVVGTNAADGWGGLGPDWGYARTQSNDDTIRKNSVESLEF